MDFNDPFTIQTPMAELSDADNFADPSMISLNPEESNASSLLTQKLSIITDTYSLDSTDYGSPLISAEPESASPLVSHDGSKRQQMSYSSYLSGRAQEVEKRRKLIQRLEKARDKGILMCSTPQISELTLTQLSMVLRRALKSSPGLREFISDDILQYVFEDGTPQTPLTTEADRIPHFPDLPNEPDCLTDHETDQSDNDNDGDLIDLPLKESCQPSFYNVRRNLLSADRFASSIIWKLIEKQNRLKNFKNYEEFQHQDAPTTNDAEADLMTCVRCRPLITKPKRNVFCVKTGEGQIFRSNSPPPPLIVNGQSDTDFDFEHKDLPAINVADKITVEHVMQSYLYRLGTMPPHFSIKHHAAFPELGKHKDFYGFPKAIQSELTNFPTTLKPVHSSVGVGQKRRNDSLDGVNEEREDDVNYPLLHKMKSEVINQQFLLKNPPKLVKSKSLYPIFSPQIAEERVAPLKIKRSSIQVSSFMGENDDLERFMNPLYKAKPHISPPSEEAVQLPTTSSLTTPIPINESPEVQQQSSPKSSSSSSSSSSDDSSSSDSEPEDVILPLKGASDDEKVEDTNQSDKQFEELDQAGSSAANNPMAHQLDKTIESGNESDNESSSSTTTEPASESLENVNIEVQENLENIENVNINEIEENTENMENMDVEN